MKTRIPSWMTTVAVIAVLALPGRAAAHHQQSAQYPYILIDLGSFGGLASYFPNGWDGFLNNQGMAAGWADTAAPDPFPGFCFNPDCLVSHAFVWHGGVKTDLGTLPGGGSSNAYWISDSGLVGGNAQNGRIDPLVAGVPENRAVVWQHGKIIDLGTLGGGHESFALTGAVNNGGQVVGASLTTAPDPYSFFAPPFSYQTRAFLWQNGSMQDLGTLGGPDALAWGVNDQGQVVGHSYTNATPNPTTGIPTIDPFLWQGGRMRDLGTLGGTIGVPTGLNDRGQVIGQSDLAGDLLSHPFLWTPDRGMQDLGTLGGDTGTTNWINDAGDVVGKADLPGPAPQNHDAFLWRNGVMTDLGTVPGDACSFAYSVNARSQVVGTSEDRVLCSIPTGGHAFLWQNGGPMVDLNTLIPPGSALQLTFALAINDRGEIGGVGVPPGCAPQDVGACGHAYVLLPRDEAAREGLTSNVPAPGTVLPAATSRTSVTPCTRGPAWRARLALGPHRPCLGG
jgi:probable HAF family extracellular repeat protein